MSTYGAIKTACPDGFLAEGYDVAHASYLSKPFPKNFRGEMLFKYDKVLMPEMNMGQLSKSC